MGSSVLKAAHEQPILSAAPGGVQVLAMAIDLARQAIGAPELAYVASPRVSRRPVSECPLGTGPSRPRPGTVRAA
ncbi:hypothetical protein [Nonomuraea sp. NPDC049784]|uniref:hypothetical protein n=1 Tax=Nonomuraea sp. NPDC049784 TaxID=3154361 RepID=UPI0033E3C579